MAKKITQETHLIEYDYDELSSADKELIAEAIAASKTAHSPYSNFEVGAALRLSDQSIVKGSNQENAAYPSGLCAERVAMFAAKSAHPEKDILAIAIVAKPREDKEYHFAAPCGSCRQVMNEYEGLQNAPIRILILGEGDKVFESQSIDNILPFGFSAKDLG